MSTAYSGSTANKATAVSARARGMSRSAASAAHEMAKAAPTMARPYSRVATSTGAESAPARSTYAGTATRTARAIATAALIGWVVTSCQTACCFFDPRTLLGRSLTHKLEKWAGSLAGLLAKPWRGHDHEGR